jgi:hypothetical protein
MTSLVQGRNPARNQAYSDSPVCRPKLPINPTFPWSRGDRQIAFLWTTPGSRPVSRSLALNPHQPVLMRHFFMLSGYELLASRHSPLIVPRQVLMELRQGQHCVRHTLARQAFPYGHRRFPFPLPTI